MPLAAARALLDPLLSFALPPRCPGCGVVVAGDHRFCLACWQSLDFLGHAACAVCAAPLEAAIARPDMRCGACLADPPPFDGMRAAVAYGPIARAVAVRLKHGARPALAATMARAMARVAPGGEGWLLVPVPLHRWRIWSRGYNQSALIARALRPHVDGRLALDLLQRRRATPFLRGMGPRARARTVDGAFAIGAEWRGRTKGTRILLIDDVYTTGATARACASILKRAGAAEVRVLCWARVGRDEEPER